MDSNVLKNDPKFKEKIKDLNITQEELDILLRILSISSDFCLNLLGVCTKASVDGTFRIAPTNWSQIFILMAKYDDKFVPVSFGFLPNKT